MTTAMRSMRLSVSCALLLLSSPLLVLCESGGRVTFEDGATEERANTAETINLRQQEHDVVNRTRQGKGLFDWIGFGTGRNVDPYLAKLNKACLSGDLAECFKSQALSSFADFFEQSVYNVNDNVRVVRMSSDIVSEVNRQPYEYSTEPRAGESEWDQLVKFAARKAEKFVKTVAFEIDVPASETGENEVYAPRFLDEIADEIDTLENKKDTLFSRHQFRKLLLPMLIVLKLFKLKLLLFLPLIFGLVSFKKFLTFMAFVIPGLIGLFKLYKPQNYQPPFYTQSGLGYPHYKDVSHGAHPYVDYNEHQNHDFHGSYNSDKISFGQDLAYQGYREYQS